MDIYLRRGLIDLISKTYRRELASTIPNQISAVKRAMGTIEAAN